MNEVANVSATALRIPSIVITKRDVVALGIELEQLDENIQAATVRMREGFQSPALPPLSDGLTQFVQQNGLDLRSAPVRAATLKQIRALKDTLPVFHMTFAAPADRASLAKLAEWLRHSVHPQAIIEDGVQPNLVAGVYLRTPNHVYDLSLRSAFADKRQVLLQQLEALGERK